LEQLIWQVLQQDSGRMQRKSARTGSRKENFLLRLNRRREKPFWKDGRKQYAAPSSGQRTN
jgi:glycerol_kin: glycerol kinase